MADVDIEALQSERDSLQEKLKAVNSESAARRKEIDKLNKTVEEVSSRFADVDLDKYSQLMNKEKEIEEAALLDGKEYEALAEKKEAEFKKRFTKLEESWGKVKETDNAKIADLTSKLERFQIDSVISSVAQDNGAISPDQVVKLVRESFALTEEGEVKINGDDGDIARDDQGSPHTPETFVKQWLSSNPHQVKATPGGSGTKAKSPSGASPSTSVGKISAGIAAKYGK